MFDRTNNMYLLCIKPKSGVTVLVGYRVRIKYHLNSRIVSTININLIKSLKPIKFDLPVATSSVSLSHP